VAFEFNTRGVLDRLQALAASLAAVSTVVVGAPLAWPATASGTVAAVVLLAGQSMTRDDSNGLLQREARFVILLGYPVQSDVAAAEQAIADAIDALLPALYSDATLNTQLLLGLQADAAQADTADYQLFAAQEVRLYPVVVRGQQLAAVA